MTKVLCSISGIEFDVPHFKIHLTSRESNHPIFDVDYQRLNPLIIKCIDQELSDTENYLLYLAVFKHSNLLEFRSPAIQTADIQSVIAQSIIPLAEIVSKIQEYKNPITNGLLVLPKLSITPDTNDFLESAEWIKIWEQCFKDYHDNYKTQTELQKIAHKESLLECKIRDRTKDISTYAHQLASWAAAAGKFPQFDAGLGSNILGGAKMSLSSYWQHIIKSCAKTESIWEIPDADIIELIEHCEEHIEHGSIYAATLMALLRTGRDRKKDFLDLGDFNIGSNGSSTFRILDPSSNLQDAAIQSAILSAPTTMPVEKDYPNKLAFIKAKLNFKIAQEHKEKE